MELAEKKFYDPREVIVKNNPNYWKLIVGIEGVQNFQRKVTAWPGTGFAVDFVVN